MTRFLLFAAAASLAAIACAKAQQRADLIPVEAAPPAQSRAHSLVLASWEWELDTPREDLVVLPSSLGGSLAAADNAAIEVPAVLWSPPRVFPFTGDYFDLTRPTAESANQHVAEGFPLREMGFLR